MQIDAAPGPGLARSIDHHSVARHDAEQFSLLVPLPASSARCEPGGHRNRVRRVTRVSGSRLATSCARRSRPHEPGQPSARTRRTGSARRPTAARSADRQMQPPLGLRSGGSTVRSQPPPRPQSASMFAVMPSGDEHQAPADLVRSSRRQMSVSHWSSPRHGRPPYATISRTYSMPGRTSSP